MKYTLYVNTLHLYTRSQEDGRDRLITALPTHYAKVKQSLLFTTARIFVFPKNLRMVGLQPPNPPSPTLMMSTTVGPSKLFMTRSDRLHLRKLTALEALSGDCTTPKSVPIR